MTRKFFLYGVAILVAWHFLGLWPPPTRSALAPDEPAQVLLADGTVPAWAYRGYRITPLATYTIKARVLHREPYYLDHGSAISPLDLALGWGRMSDPAVYEKLSISQSWRFYFWSYSGAPPIPYDEIVASSANTHLIFTSPDVQGKLYWVRAGDVVKLSGYLVQASGLDGSQWISSLSRTDTGNGACELMWVKEAEIAGR